MLTVGVGQHGGELGKNTTKILNFGKDTNLQNHGIIILIIILKKDIGKKSLTMYIINN